MKVSLIDGIDYIHREEWNQITGLEYPFMRHEFLHALEKSGCVTEATGWLPQHCLVHEQDDLIALMPLYKKMHSHGEYVFDFEWANAYCQHGLSYYPKWLTAVPFTPCEGGRLYVKSGVAEAAVAKVILNFIVENADSYNISTWHCLYPTLAEVALYKSAGLSIREGVNFRWNNRGYRDFKDYLDSFNSKRRKNLLRERRFVTEQGISFKHIHGKDITAEQLNVFFQFYQLTYLKRGNPPYLNLRFFEEIFTTMPEQLFLILAVKDDTYVGTAFSFIGAGNFYGRYWGCYQEYHSLHFETCYYQGLEYCINNGLQRFDPGAQGEHKIARGFEPETTYSAHWVHDAKFAAAVEQFTRREANAVAQYRNQIAKLLPFKK